VAKILIVDDDTACLSYLALFLREAGHEVVTCEDGADAVVTGGAVCPDVLISDMLLGPACTGADVALALREALPKLKVLLVTGLPGLAAKNLRGLTDATVLEKPLFLRPLVRDILDHHL
jgi:DNA-binding response OmpR family regulator